MSNPSKCANKNVPRIQQLMSMTVATAIFIKYGCAKRRRKAMKSKLAGNHETTHISVPSQVGDVLEFDCGFNKC